MPNVSKSRPGLDTTSFTLMLLMLSKMMAEETC